MKGIRLKHIPKGTNKWGFQFERPKVDGQRKQIERGGFATKALAQAEGQRMYNLYYSTDKKVQKSDMAYTDFLKNVWIKTDCVDLKPSTIAAYEKTIRNRIEPTIGCYPISAITREQLQQFLLDVFDQGFSLNTISNLKALLTKSFAFAYDEKYITELPTVRLKLPKNRKPKIVTRSSPNSYILPEIRDKIFERYPERTPAHLPLKLGFECGLRRGEVFGLTWDDIDFDKKTLTIHRQENKHVDAGRSTVEKMRANGTSECGNGYWYLASPKTQKSKRVIDLSDDMLDLLKREKARQEKAEAYYEDFYCRYYLEHPLSSDVSENRITETPNDNPVNFVCRNDNGTRLTYHTIEHATAVIKREIYKEFTFHSCRHTHATTLCELGLPDVYIQHRLGHSKSIITIGTYEHVSDNLRAQCLTTINNYYQSA